MPIQFVSGDLFLNQYHAQAFAHGCNCKGVMGAGIAVRFKQEYPAMYREYRRRCKAYPRQFNLGDSFLWPEANKPSVFNLATQEFPGKYATCDAIEKALGNMMAQAGENGITSIALPRIGSGCGGLLWKDVRVLIEKVFANWPGNLIVYEGFEYCAGDENPKYPSLGRLG